MKLSVYTQNMWLLPFRVSKHNSQRFQKLLTQVDSLQPDVVCLQEVWSSGFVKKLHQELPNYQVVSNGKGTFNRPGLVLLTKGAVIKNTRLDIKLGKEDTILSKLDPKGAHCITVKFGQLLVNVHNIHLHASMGEDDPETDVAVAQLGKVLDQVDGNQPTIVAGDFNLVPARVKPQLQDLNLKLSSDGLTVQRENPYQQSRYNVVTRNQFKIDYILFSNKHLNLDSSHLVGVDDPFSDHYGIYSELEVMI